VLTFHALGKAALKRVFLGVGWAATPGQRIDVDCCCAPFTKGVAVAADTVWFGNLRSRDVGGDAKGFCTVKHSGDVLGGQPTADDGKSSKPGLVYLCRIFAWISL
jgi:stress response protein SCP2